MTTRLPDRQPPGHRSGPNEIIMYSIIVRQTNRQTDRQAGRQTDRQTLRQTDKQADRHTD